MPWKRRISALLIAAITISTTLVTAPTAQAVPTQQTSQTYPQAKKQLDDTFKQISALRKLIDRSQFDLAALGFALGGDAEAIIDFVRDEIAFESYPGLLRGAQGTLQSRAGNAIDQAVLLHRLLVDAGYEAHILQGALADDQAQSLLTQMFQPRPPVAPISQQMEKLKKLFGDLTSKTIKQAGAAPELLQQIVDLSLTPPPVTATVPYSYTLADTDYLQALLTKANITLGDPEAEAKLLNEAKAYFWVQYRLVPADPWQQVHPLFAEEEAPANLKPQAKFADEGELPADLYQQFRLEIEIERKQGDVIETLPIIEPAQATVASLGGRTISFAISPDGFTDTADLIDPLGSLQKSKFFFPLINGELAKGAMFFDRLGNLLPPDIATSPYAGLATGVVGSLGSALDALEGFDSTNGEQSQYLLLGVTAKFTLLAPGGVEKTMRRTLLDRVGAENRAAGKHVLAQPNDPDAGLSYLTAQQTFMLAAGSYPAAFVLDQALAYLLQLRPLLEIALKSGYQTLSPEEIFDKKLKEVNTDWPAHLDLYAIFDMAASTSANLVQYRAEPSLVIHKQEQQSDRVRAWIDIVHNQRRSYERVADQVVASPAALLRTGIWETRTEGVVLPSEASSRVNTIALFRQAEAAKIPIHVLSPDQPGQIAKIKGSPQLQALLQAELAAGNVVIVPQSLPKDATQLGYWRIDPASGTTVGMMENGMGTSMVEYAVLLGMVSVIGTSSCLAIAGKDSNGITPRDLAVCGLLVGVVGGGGMAITLVTATAVTAGLIGLGLIIFAALAIGTGIWLNANNDFWDRPMGR